MNAMQDPAPAISRYYVLQPRNRVVVHDYITRNVGGVFCHPAEFIYGFRRTWGYVPVDQRQSALPLVA